jgi:hypothetical protein
MGRLAVVHNKWSNKKFPDKNHKKKHFLTAQNSTATNLEVLMIFLAM